MSDIDSDDLYESKNEKTVRKRKEAKLKDRVKSSAKLRQQKLRAKRKLL
jgi:hypothetical protein